MKAQISEEERDRIAEATRIAIVEAFQKEVHDQVGVDGREGALAAVMTGALLAVAGCIVAAMPEGTPREALKRAMLGALAGNIDRVCDWRAEKYQ